jgi:hypothetical protein
MFERQSPVKNWETVIGKHVDTSLVRYFQMPWATRNRDKILWTKGKLRNKVILTRKNRTARSGRIILLGAITLLCPQAAHMTIQ